MTVWYHCLDESESLEATVPSETRRIQRILREAQLKTPVRRSEVYNVVTVIEGER